jgi:PilZ domain
MQERRLRRGHRRRSDRLPAEISLQLTGTSEAGQEFTEESRTLTLSQHGASLLSKRKLVPEQEIVIRRADTGREAKVRVAGKIADRTEGYIYAVEFVEPQTNLWETEFPSTSDPDEPEDRVFLVCGCCGKIEAVQFGESKLGRFEVAHGVLLYCIQCQAMTRWLPRSDDSTAPQSS